MPTDHGNSPPHIPLVIGTIIGAVFAFDPGGYISSQVMGKPDFMLWRDSPHARRRILILFRVLGLIFFLTGSAGLLYVYFHFW